MPKLPAGPKVDEPPPAEAPESPLKGLLRGRIVYYWPHPYEARNADGGPWPSMVTNVQNLEGVVTLNVNLPAPMNIGVDPVSRRADVPYSPTPEPGCWSWMYEGQNQR